MPLSSAYKMHNYMGEYSSESNCLTFIRTNKWDSSGDGNGNPRSGMQFYDTGSNQLKVYTSSSWLVLGSAAPAGSTTQVQFNNAGSFGADSGFVWDNTNKQILIENSNAYSGMQITTAETTDKFPFISFRRYRNTIASPSAVQSGDTLALMSFVGRGATGNYTSAQFVTYADGNFTNSSSPGYIVLRTTPSGSTTPADRMRITSAGNVLIGTAAGYSVNGTVSSFALQVSGADSAPNYIGIAQEAAAANARFNGLRCNGSFASKTAVANNDVLASFNGLGWDGGTTPTYNTSSGMVFLVDGTVAEDSVPGRISFWTRAVGNTSGTTERMRITSAGNILIGTEAGVSQSGVTYTNKLLVSGTNNSLSDIDVAIEVAATRAALHLYRCNNTVSSKTVVVSGDNLGAINFYGWDGGTTPTYVTASQIKTEVDGTVSEDVVPGRIVFGTRNTGGTFAERIRITSAGLLGIANTSPSALLTLGTAGTTAGSLSLAGATSGTCTVQVAAAAGTTTFQLPVGNGTNGYYLKTDGSGLTSWAAVSATPAGSSYQVQYNNGGAFGASSEFDYSPSDAKLTLSGDQKTTAYIASSYGGDGLGVVGFYSSKIKGSKSSPAAMASTDRIGTLTLSGSFNTSGDTTSAWSLIAFASGAWSSGSTPSYLQFLSRNTSTNQYQIMRLDYAGNVGIGTHTSLTERLDLYDGSGNGAIRIGNAAGTNAGTIKYASNTFSGYNGSSWVNFGGGAPAGSTTQVQFNNAGAFGADAGFTWDNTNKQILLPGDNAYSGIHITSAATTNKFSFIILRRYRNTIASPSAVQSGDTLGQIAFQGFGATANRVGADFVGYADGTWTDSSSPTYMVLRTSPSGSTTPVERMRITSSGNVLIGTTAGYSINGSTINYTLQVSGADSGSNLIGVIQEAAAVQARFNGLRCNGSLASKTAVANDEVLVAFNGWGWDGGTTPTYNGAAVINFLVDGTVAEDSVPGRIAFYTRAVGNTSTNLSERMRITNAGNVCIGTTTPATVIGGTTYSCLLKVSNDESSPTNIGTIFLETAGGGATVRSLRCNTSLASKTIVANEDIIANFIGFGYDGTDYEPCASLQFVVDGTPGSNDMPGKMIFKTTPDGSSTTVERMRITNAGNVFIGTTAGLNVTGSVQNFPLIVYGSDSNPQFSGIANESSATPARFSGYRHNGTLASKTAVASGDHLFSLNFSGWDGGTTPTYVGAGSIQCYVDGTVSEDLVPGRITFNTRNTSGTLAERMRITSAGGVGIGVTALDANYLLQLPNSSSQKAKAYAWDTYACSELWKTNIVPIPNSLDKINSLHGITFNYNYPEENHPMNGLEGIGITAEELESLGLPNLITKDNGTYTSINLSGIIPVLVEAIKELKVRLEALE